MNSPKILFELKVSYERRIQTIFSLLKDYNQITFDALEFCLKNDPSPIVRHEAAYVLGEMKDKRGVKFLIKAIENDTDKFVVHEATLALSNLGKLAMPEGKIVIEKLLSDQDPDILDTAEISLQRLIKKLSDKTLTINPEEAIKNLTNSNKENRIQASFMLMEDASENSIDILIEALNNEPSGIVKHEIIFSIGESIANKAVPELLKVLKKEKNVFALHETILALATIGNKRAEGSIRLFLNHEDPNISETAEIALERLFS